MKILITILLILFVAGLSQTSAQQQTKKFDFFGESIELPVPPPLIFEGPLSVSTIQAFHDKINTTEYISLLTPLLAYKKKFQPDDWLYYQLVRKAAESISPKKENYHRYTLFKWFFLTRSGYDAILALSGNMIFFYAASDNNIYNIPTRISNGKSYICLNYHDYAPVDFNSLSLSEVSLKVVDAQNVFSYKITRLPHFKATDYLEKEIDFTYNHIPYQFRIKVNPLVKIIFNNYPNADYESHFNMPLSEETYSTLIPALKKAVKGLNEKDGVEFLMHFTRNTFVFKTDTEVFGGEKRLSPELTLLNDFSDCEDRAALFFFLVKEMYALPMIVVTYPQHVSIAVKFNKPIGNTVLYNGSRYSICEPSPQKKELGIGEILPELRNTPYEISYAYTPVK